MDWIDGFYRLFNVSAYADDPEKARIARLLATLVLINCVVAFLVLAVGTPFVFVSKRTGGAMGGLLLLTCLLSWGFARSGRLKPACVLLVADYLLIAAATNWVGGGIESKYFVLYAMPIGVSTLLLTRRGALAVVVISLVTMAVFAGLSWFGVVLPRVLSGSPKGFFFLLVMMMGVLYLSIQLSVDGWHQALGEARRELEQRKRTESERDELREQLFQARKMESLGRMAGSVAHDFNNLLTVMSLSLDLVKARHDDREDLGGELAPVESAMQSAQKMIRSLLDFAKKRELRLEQLELDEVIRESRPVLEQLLGDGAKLEMELEASGERILADRTGLEQVFQNLVVNARLAMGKNGLLTVHTDKWTRESDHPDAKAGRYLRVKVRDTGVGMSAELKEKVFEPFFTTREDGTGLGLATVFGIVKQHGGFIEVDSEPGHGTEFRVCLPCPPSLPPRLSPP